LAKKKRVDFKNLEESIAHQPEPHYSREELINAASSFGVKPEVVAGAMRLAGRDSMTRGEAEKAIKRFLERVVK